MARRRQVRRRVRRARPAVRRAPSASAAAMRMDAKRSESGDSGLMIGGVQDSAEKAADRVADRVMRMPAAGQVLQRKCPACEGEEKKVQRKPEEADKEGVVQAKPASNSVPIASGAGSAAASPGAVAAIRSMGTGTPLARAERAFYEPPIGTDLSSVRVHDGPGAEKATHAVSARAFTLGTDIAFARGEYQPKTEAGRHLMAHELAHVAAGDKDMRRKGDVCSEVEVTSHRALFVTEVTAAQATGDENKAILAIKKLQRCDTTADDAHVSGVLTKFYDAKKARKLIAASKTSLGGYVGFYPGYAGDIKTRLGEIGVTDTEGHKAFTTSASGRKHSKRAARTAKSAEAQLDRADILYFRGHQFAQFRAPGMFTDGKQERGVDLRYLQRAGGFPNVKLMISTSCATLCNEAIQVFTGLFPKATIFGYGKSAPIEGGQVRREFGKQVRALKSPLLLESTSDISKLTGAWKATIEKRHPRERDVKRVRPGFYDGSKLFYWSGKAWVDGENGKPANNCRRKGNFRGQFPAPRLP